MLCCCFGTCHLNCWDEKIVTWKRGQMRNLSYCKVNSGLLFNCNVHTTWAVAQIQSRHNSTIFSSTQNGEAEAIGNNDGAPRLQSAAGLAEQRAGIRA